MERDKNRDPRDSKIGQPSYNNPPDMTPRREGGDDALAETDPDDPRADEMVMANEHGEHKTVNGPSQTAANLSERDNDDEAFM